MTTDALLARARVRRLRLDKNTVVVMDEAGMADTNRLAALAEVTARAESKLVLVGDSAQLSAIGAGGMFAELQGNVPTAELQQVHRAQHAWEREAWQQLARAKRRRRWRATRRTVACTSQTRASRPRSGWSAVGPRPRRSMTGGARS